MTSLTSQASRFVKLSDVINACVVLSQTTGPQVHKVLTSGALNAIQKGECKMDVCTEADLRIQKTIQHNLKELFPRARLICEEEDSSIDESIRPSL
jgi:3'-phosphoadenosine 5'-phosphosulfate (PAPS) 3'-phosphatase